MLVLALYDEGDNNVYATRSLATALVDELDSGSGEDLVRFTFAPLEVVSTGGVSNTGADALVSVELACDDTGDDALVSSVDCGGGVSPKKARRIASKRSSSCRNWVFSACRFSSWC